MTVEERREWMLTYPAPSSHMEPWRRIDRLEAEVASYLDRLQEAHEELDRKREYISLLLEEVNELRGRMI